MTALEVVSYGCCLSHDGVRLSRRRCCIHWILTCTQYAAADAFGALCLCSQHGTSACLFNPGGSATVMLMCALREHRPNPHFNSNGVMTHINFAADLTTPNAGCNDYMRRKGAPGGKNEDKTSKQEGGERSCASCKFYNHCGTTIVALDV